MDATWLRPKWLWRRQYRDWPALTKLEPVDAWLTDCRCRPPSNSERTPQDVLSENQRTLANEEKRAFYGVGASTRFDDDLKRIFARPSGARANKSHYPSATSMLKAIRASVRNEVARPLGVPSYTVDQVLRQLIQRAQALDLKHARPHQETVNDVVNLVSSQTAAILKRAPRLPL